MGGFTPYEKYNTLCISGLQNHPSQALGAVGTPVYTLNVRLPAAFRINYIDTAAAPSPRLRRHTRGESPRCASAPPLTLFPLLCCRGWHGFAKALSIPSPTPASCWGFSPHHLLLRHPSQHLFPAPLPAPSPCTLSLLSPLSSFPPLSPPPSPVPFPPALYRGSLSEKYLFGCF